MPRKPVDQNQEASEKIPILFDGSGAEDEEDLEPVKFSDAVTWATDWTTETLVKQLERRTILMDPTFQRRDAWKETRKSRFIESLILGLPIPQIVLAERQDKRGTFIVLDGKQRLLSLLQFCASDSNGNGLELTGLTLLKNLIGVTYSRMQQDPTLDEIYSRFQNQSIRTVIIKNWPNEDYLYTVFLRLNSNSVPLSPQELRKALHPGPFVDFADDRSSNSKVLQAALNLERPDFRMRDVEIVVRYYAFENFIDNYRGNLKGFLDDACKKLNRTFNSKKSEIERQFGALEKAILLTEKIFTKRDAFRKYTVEGGYERRLNRAVFDICLFYFSREPFAGKALQKAAEIRNSFETLCVTDEEFRRSIETTTKSIEGVTKRFNTWGETLGDVLKIRFRPVL